MKEFLETLAFGFQCKCPKCKSGDLYRSAISLTLNAKCPVCGLDLAQNDSADGPAVFLIFILGFLIVPLALVVEFLFHWPIWVHTLVWGVVLLALTVGSLRPLKSYIIALQFKYRPEDWGER